MSCSRASWLPKKVTAGRAGRILPGAVYLGSLALGVFSVSWPELLPTLERGGGFTPVAQALNVGGGAGFLVAALYFVLLRYRTKAADSLPWASQCLLFGMAGILFAESSLWDGNWWLWHVLRALAYR